MPAAVAIPMLVGGGLDVAGSLIGAHSASTAAKDQTQAAQQALALEQQIYKDQQARTQPYVTAGTQALGGLMQNYGGGQNFNAQIANALSPYQNVTAVQRLAMPMSSLAAMGQNQPMPAAPPPMGGGTVTVVDDSGAQRQVPASQASLYQQRGFRVLGGGGGLPQGRTPMSGGPMTLNQAFMG